MGGSDEMPYGKKELGSSLYLQQEDGGICRHDRDRILSVTLEKREYRVP
jgi:hypothetical protein